MKTKFIITVVSLLIMVCDGYSVYGSTLAKTKKFMRANVEVLTLDEPRKNDTKTVIRVGLEKMHRMDLHEEYAKRVCLLDDERPMLVDEVKKVVYVDDQHVVQCKNKVLLFDARTGVLKTSFSGQWGPDAQFVVFLDTWVEGDTVCVYDMSRKLIFRYNFNGDVIAVKFVDRNAQNNPFQCLAKIAGGYYVGKRVYSGMEDSELNLYDKNFDFVQKIGDLKIESGIYLGYPFFEYRPNEVLYCRYLYNDIYAIDDKQNVIVKYYIDFGENNVPLNPNLKDEYDRIDFVNSSKKKYATFVSNIYELDKYFCFNFIFDGKKCLGVYDKSRGKTASFEFISSSESPRSDVYVFDDKALLVTQDMDKTCLTTISVDDLLKND